MNGNAFYISREASIQLKASAIILVLIGHLVPPFLPFHEIYIPAKRFLSQVGVNLFMFVSGYGICVNYLTSKIHPGKFLLRRFSLLWPLYIVCLISTYCFQTMLFGKTVSCKVLFIHLIGLQVYFGVENEIYLILHFMSAICVVYVFTAIALCFKPTNRRKALGLVFFLHALITYTLTGKVLFIDYFTSFAVGILWASRSINKGFIWQDSFLLFQTVLLLIVPDKLLVLFLSVFSVYFLLKLLKKGNSSLLASNSMIWMGTNSYLIYLGHNYFFWKWPQLLNILGTKLKVGLVIVIVTTIWMYVLFVTNRLLGKIISSRAIATFSFFKETG